MRTFAVAILATFLSVNAFAIVDMKNANYSNTWIDMEVPGTGYDLKIVRTYNSRSLFNGMFGFGWCSDFETKLEITGDGFLKLRECGAGQEVVYAPQEIKTEDVQAKIKVLVEKIKKDSKGKFTDDYFKKLSQEVFRDDDRRNSLFRKYGISTPVKEGMKYMANGKEVEHIIYAKNIFTRQFTDGSYQRFSPEGKLTHHYDRNGNFLKFEYDKDLITQITDNNARRLSFKYFPNRKVKEIVGPNSLKAEYKFANLDDLSWAKNAQKNEFAYDYDELHNLTKAVWPDKTAINIKYDTKRDWVTNFTDRDKCVENYTYELSKDDPKNHYSSTVKKTCGKEVVAENKYEFWYKQKADGNPFLARVITNVGTDSTDISYHEVFGKPISITKNKEKTVYEYYSDGQVKLKASPLNKMSYTYHPTVKKVSEVKTDLFDAQGKKQGSRTTKFDYDGKGNLIFAQNNDGQKITMTYDPKGRISTITDQAKKVVSIQYEERLGKPAVVSRPGLGTIKVSYKPNGDILKVDSKEGPSVAVQVASTFNNLLDIIAPATAELYL
ncbi:MAG: DUF6531 domain-containing protein [Bdellovibrionota bacterium]